MLCEEPSFLWGWKSIFCFQEKLSLWRLHGLMEGNHGGRTALCRGTEETTRAYGGNLLMGLSTGSFCGHHTKPEQHCAFPISSELKEQSRRSVCPWAPEHIRSGWVPPGWCFLQRVGQSVSLSLWVKSNAKHIYFWELRRHKPGRRHIRRKK